MNKGTLTLSISFLVLGLLGGITLIADIWINLDAKTSAHFEPTPPVIDGLIGHDEYKNHQHDDQTGMDLYWSVIGTKIYVGLKSPGTGWLAIGFAPEGPGMKGSDIVIGYVQDDGVVAIEDHYARTDYTHTRVTELEAEENILSYGGSENENGTLLEFERLLAPDSEFSKPIVPGSMWVQLAYGDFDKFAFAHAKRSSIFATFIPRQR